MKKFGRSFNLLLISQVISLIGGGLFNFALLLFILDVSQSAGTLALVLAITQIPAIVLPLAGGILADRFNRQKMLVILDGTKAIYCVVLLVLFVTNTYSIASMTVIMTLIMCNVALFGPLALAIPPSIVSEEHLVEANGAVQGIEAISTILSAILGGVLFATLGIQNLIILVCLAFVASTVIDLFISIPHKKQATSEGIIQTIKSDLGESFTFAAKSKPLLLRLALCFTFMSFVAMPIVTVGLNYVVRIQFESTDFMFGLAQGLIFCGMLVGAVLSGLVKKQLKVSNVWKFMGIAGLLCGLLAVSVQLQLFWGFIGALFLAMVVVMWINITAMSVFQEETPEHLIGKMMALVLTLSALMAPFGTWLFGQMLEVLVGQLWLLFAVVAGFLLVLALASRKILGGTD